MSRVLLLCDDEALRAEVGRLAGPLEVRRPGPAARAAWLAAPVVVVGLDAVGAVSTSGLPRRERVVLVATRELSGDEWATAVALGVAAVAVLPGQERVLLDQLSAAAGGSDDTTAVIGVIAGCGGAGASTTAAALAIVASRDGAAVLVDADPHGGGLDVLLGIEDLPGTRWRDLDGKGPAAGPAALVGALPRLDGLAVLSGGFGELYQPPPATVLAVRDLLRRAFVVVVVDLPRTFDPAAEVWLAAVDFVVVVTLGAVRAVAATATVTRSLADRGVRTALVTRDIGGAALSGDDVATGLGLPVAGAVRSDPAVRSAAEHGHPPVSPARSARRRRAGSLDRLCQELLRNVSGSSPGDRSARSQSLPAGAGR